jgi:16S rRNA (uracil1498-N3)-methyltransferase
MAYIAWAQREGCVRRRFFVGGFNEGTARIEGDAAHHLARVLRADPGQLYELSDGRSVFLGRIERVEREAVHFAVLEPVATREERLRVTLLMAVVKFERFEWALEKATELGAHSIVPLAAERSEKMLVGAAGKRAERWRRLLLESAQQARCLRIPELQPVQLPRDAFRAAGDAVKVLLSERAGAPALQNALAEAVSRQRANSSSVPVQLCLAVGPEGGWTDAEFAAAAEFDFGEASIGELVLRTETAVVAGLAAAHLYFDPH